MSEFNFRIRMKKYQEKKSENEFSLEIRFDYLDIELINNFLHHRENKIDKRAQLFLVQSEENVGELAISIAVDLLSQGLYAVLL